MDNKIGSIDNDGNITDAPITDDFNNMTASTSNETTNQSSESTSYNSGFNESSNTNEEFDVFGNSVQEKRGFNKKLLLIPLVIVLILIIGIIIFTSSNNKYTLKSKSFVIKVDETANIEIEAKEKVKQKITYSSENEKIATVDKNGKITGETIGTTTIYVGINGKKSDKVNVKVETNKEDLRFKETNITINKDATYQLAIANVLDSDVFEWTSNNENVVTVDQTGLITGVHAGSTTVVVRESDGRSASTRVSVTSDEILIDSISLSNQTIAIGEKVTLNPTITPFNGLKILTWKSNKESVVEIDANGVVTGISKGTATITVNTHNGKTARAKITVDETLPASIKINGCTGGIAINTPITLKVDYSPSTAKSNITWTSSNTNIATVSGGRVTAKSVGSVTITAMTKNGKAASCKLKVSPMSITKLSVSPTSLTLDQEATKKISVSLTPSAAKEYYTVKWSSSNKNVAIVDSDGKVIGINPGTATITASAGGKSAKVTVKVNATAVTSIQMTGCKETAKVYDTFKLTSTALPTTAKNKTITYSSSDSTIATVSSTGSVSLKEVGIVTITASTKNGKTATCTINVQKPDVTSFTANKTSASIKVNGTTTITTSTNLTSTKFNKFYTVTWRSANPNIASVTPNSSNSLSATIKGLKAGGTTIHATVAGRMVTIQVTVT